ncbi:DUF742 domain-containing protein [Saccharopolyspora sp. K220]|uniref:DUF742 domain-containing protein n=1 Tax=Saccharopolyspora soli TaxID=2926618 RepID=UPI001F572E0E|nr:DUF742 domain-containing protein [Saccharopolyspora soli]MCI2416641.1 DUF742 domain-containing protein [Saccharopolyspora soli]
MSVPPDKLWLDNEAGPLLRPYSLTNGRTKPTAKLTLQSMVRSTGRLAPERIEPVHAKMLELCQFATSVAEVAAHLRQPAVVTKVLLSDLIDWGAVTTRVPDDVPDREQLEALLLGLQQL